jgi:hypothetical protein
MRDDDGFLNVDLEVGARLRAELVPLVAALDDTLFELFRGRIRGLYRAHYETKLCARNASVTVHELAAVIEALAPPARAAWNGATMRDFNIGIELARGVRSVELAIDPDAIRRVAALGGRLAFTAYQVSAMTHGRAAGMGAQKPQSTQTRNASKFARRRR